MPAVRSYPAAYAGHWLNPEARNSWRVVGDAEMRRYSAYCHQADECNSLMHLERVVGNLLKTVR